MAKKDPAKLKDQAAKQLRKGKLDKALELYQELEKIAKDDLRVPQKIAEILIKMGRKQEAVEKYKQAAEKYREHGFLIQAIALYKVVLENAPDDEDAKKAVSALRETKEGPTLGKRKHKPEPKAEPAPPPPTESEASEADKPEPVEAQVEPAESLPEEPAEPEPPAAEPEAESEEAEIALEPEAPGPEPETPKEEEAEPAIPLEDEESAIELSSPDEETPLELTEEEPGGSEPAAEVLPLEQEEELPPKGPEETPLFSDLKPGEFERVFELLTSRVEEKGALIVKEGESGDSIFIIARGEVEVIRKKNGEEKVCAILGPGEFFGEIGYFHGKRTATVKARRKCLLLEMAKADLDQVVEEFPRVKEVLDKFYRERVLENLLADSPVFSALSEQERKVFKDRFQFRSFGPGEIIVKEGDPGESMFIIKDGEVSVRTIHPETREEVELARLQGGDFFGEVSLIKNKPRTATVIAETETQLLELAAQDFKEIAEKHPEIGDALEKTIEKRVEDTIKKMVEKM